MSDLKDQIENLRQQMTGELPGLEQVIFESAREFALLDAASRMMAMCQEKREAVFSQVQSMAPQLPPPIQQGQRLKSEPIYSGLNNEAIDEALHEVEEYPRILRERELTEYFNGTNGSRRTA